MILALVSPLLAADLTGILEGNLEEDEVLVEAIDSTLRVVGSASADPSGAFQLAGLPAIPFRLRATPLEEQGLPDRYFPDGDTWCEGALVGLEHGEDSSGHVVILEEGGRLTGRLSLPDGGPAVGASVVAVPAGDEPIPWQRSVLVDEEGSFALSGLPTVASGVRVEVIHDDHPQSWIGGYDLVDAEEFLFFEGEVQDLGELTLGEGVDLSGRVEDPEGEPQAGVKVRVRIGTFVESVETAEDGTWSVQGMRAGAAEVWVAHDGWAVHYWPGSDRPTELIPLNDDGDVVDDVLLQVVPEASLTGRIVGGPADLEELTLRALNDDESVSIKVEVDEEGFFTAHRLGAGAWNLRVRGEELGGIEDHVREDDGGVSTWTLGEGEQRDIGEVNWIAEAVLGGRILDHDGFPVHGATVTAFPDAHDLPQVSATTDDHGRYRLTSLVAGPYRLRASLEALCKGDPDFVDVWWPEERLQAWGEVLHPVAGTELSGLELRMPFDRDHDGMDDDWEVARGLDPTRDDGAEDPDQDGYSNLEEYQLGTDPRNGGGEGVLGGCSNPLSLSALFLVPLVGFRRRSSPGCL